MDPKNYLSFDIGHRVRLANGREFVEFESEEQFTLAARGLASRAAETIAEYRAFLPSLRFAASYLASIAEGNPHALSHAGIAFGLSGEPDLARRHFDEVLQRTDGERAGRAASLHGRVCGLRELLGVPSAFRERILGDIADGREQLKLLPWPNSSGVI